MTILVAAGIGIATVLVCAIVGYVAGWLVRIWRR